MQWGPCERRLRAEERLAVMSHSTLTVGIEPTALPDGVPVPDILPAAPPG